MALENGRLLWGFRILSLTLGHIWMGEKAKGLEGEHHLGINGFQETPHWLGFPTPLKGQE